MDVPLQFLGSSQVGGAESNASATTGLLPLPGALEVGDLVIFAGADCTVTDARCDATGSTGYWRVKQGESRDPLLVSVPMATSSLPGNASGTWGACATAYRTDPAVTFLPGFTAAPYPAGSWCVARVTATASASFPSAGGSIQRVLSANAASLISNANWKRTVLAVAIGHVRLTGTSGAPFPDPITGPPTFGPISIVTAGLSERVNAGASYSRWMDPFPINNDASLETVLITDDLYEISARHEHDVVGAGSGVGHPNLSATFTLTLRMIYVVGPTWSSEDPPCLTQDTTGKLLLFATDDVGRMAVRRYDGYSESVADPVVKIVDKMRGCFYPQYDLREGIIEGTYLRAGASVLSRNNLHCEEGWEMQPVPGTYTASASVAERARRVFTGWTGAAWVVRVGILTASGTLDWSEEVTIPTTNPTGQCALHRDVDDGSLVFTYKDAADEWKILHCYSLADDATGVWQ